MVLLLTLSADRTELRFFDGNRLARRRWLVHDTNGKIKSISTVAAREVFRIYEHEQQKNEVGAEVYVYVYVCARVSKRGTTDPMRHDWLPLFKG